MNFLQTRSGALASGSIDTISAVNTRPNGNSFHEVEYHIGREPRLTRATPAAVQEFFDTWPFGPSNSVRR